MVLKCTLSRVTFVSAYAMQAGGKQRSLSECVYCILLAWHNRSCSSQCYLILWFILCILHVVAAKRERKRVNRLKLACSSRAPYDFNFSALPHCFEFKRLISKMIIMIETLNDFLEIVIYWEFARYLAF